jgi:AAA domain
MEITPKGQRQFQTVVIDTLDGFQRKVKEEWLQDTKAGIFSGRDAWGYLDSKMQALLVKLLNLDYNIMRRSPGSMPSWMT